MINPSIADHPSYPVTEEIREKNPDESKRWEDLLRKVRDPAYRGCFTCMNYHPPKNELLDVETVDGTDNGAELPWDTEQAWVNCALFQEHQTSLRINCQWWRSLEGKVSKKKS